MAWVHGNDPTGFQIREGRILCEAMFAINEREYCCNIAKTVWTDAGVDPAVNALAGKTVTTARKATLIGEMRTAIEAVLTSFVGADTAFYPAGEYIAANYYTKATLLTAAFGAANWCVLTGKDVNDVQPVAEILKAVELLRYAGYMNSLDGNPYHKSAFKFWDPPPAPPATPQAAYVLCQALAASPWVNSAPGLSWYERVETVPPNYDAYGILESCERYDLRIAATASINTASVWYTTDATHTAVGTRRIYEVTAGMFGAPNWGAQGNLRHTLDDIPAGANTSNAEVFDDASFLSVGINTYYLKTIEHTTSPFVDNDTDQRCGGVHYGILFDLAWTYN